MSHHYEECPQGDELSRFAVGLLAPDAVEVIGRHVESCPACQSTLASMAHTNDALVSGLRRPCDPDPFIEESACFRVVEEVQRLGDSLAEAPGEIRGTPVGASLANLGVRTELGDYLLLERLGRGGMGTVFKAQHVQLGTLAVVKVLHARGLHDSDAVARFLREMEAIGRLDHRNIVRAIDADEVDGIPFLVMELVDGVDLSQLVALCGPVDIPSACEVIRQAAIGLEHAHQHGLVHRDVKPSNLMLATDGVVKILDLGLARLRDRTPENELTTTHQIMGTLDYMAPEQGSSTHHVDIRADLYGLGCTFYKLLTGQPPFWGREFDTPVKKIMAHVQAPVPPIRDRRSEVPEALAAVIERMLAKSPDERLGTPAEVAEALGPFADDADLPDMAVQAKEKQEPNSDAGALMTMTAQRVPVSAGRRPRAPRTLWHYGALAGLVLLLFAFGIYLAPWTLSLVRGEGKLVVECDEQSREIVEARGVLIYAPALNRGYLVREGASDLDAGDYEIPASQPSDRLAFNVPSFSLDSGGTAVLKVTARPVAELPGGRERALRWFEHALLCLREDETQLYRQVCDRMQESLAASDDPDAVAYVVRTCALSPTATADPAVLLRLANKAIERDPKHWYFHAMGLAHYRAGRFEDAIGAIEGAVKLEPTWDATVLNWLVLGMAHLQLGRPIESRQWLGRAFLWIDRVEKQNKDTDQTIDALPMHFDDWLECQLLRAEADALIESASLTFPPRVDLLALIDPGRDSLEGEWRLEEDSLVAPDSETARLEIPYMPPEQYDLVLTGQRVSGEDGLCLGILVGGRQCQVVVDGHSGEAFVSGVDGLKDGERPERLHHGQVISDEEQVTIICAVRKVGAEHAVSVECDGAEILRWQGHDERLSLSPTECPAHNRILFLGTRSSSFRINEMQLIPITIGGCRIPFGGESAPDDRLAAERVLWKGGRVSVSVDGRELRIGDINDLPTSFALRAIDLRGNHHFPNADLGFITSLHGLDSLALLDLGKTSITDGHLHGPLALRNLVTLRLDLTQIGDETLAQLAASECKGLRILSLAGTRVSDQGLKHVAGLAQLEELDLRATAISDEGTEHLKSLAGLKRLVLGQTGITDAGLASLSEIKGLQHLYLDGTQVTPKGLEVLRASLPQCAVTCEVGEPVDLLAVIDAERDALEGDWTVQAGALVSPSTHGALLQIPFSPPDEYTLEVTIQRESGCDGVAFGLVAGGRQVALSIDSWPNRGSITALDTIGGHRGFCPHNGTGVKTKVLAPGEPVTLVVSVRKSGIAVMADDRLLIDWSGESKQCGLASDWSVPENDRLFIAGCSDSFRISRIQLAPIETKSAPPEPGGGGGAL